MTKYEGLQDFGLKDPELWDKSVNNNLDGYGRAGHEYMATWAYLMEARMAKGEKLADIASECDSQANENIGITGFMYGMVVSTLSAVWTHGEELRQWHNLDSQIGDEGEKANESGGCLNPAILNIG